MTKEEKAIEILMEDAGYYWCDMCEVWRLGTEDDYKDHLRYKHF